MLYITCLQNNLLKEELLYHERKNKQSIYKKRKSNFHQKEYESIIKISKEVNMRFRIIRGMLLFRHQRKPTNAKMKPPKTIVVTIYRRKTAMRIKRTALGLLLYNKASMVFMPTSFAASKITIIPFSAVAF